MDFDAGHAVGRLRVGPVDGEVDGTAAVQLFVVLAEGSSAHRPICKQDVVALSDEVQGSLRLSGYHRSQLVVDCEVAGEDTVGHLLGLVVEGDPVNVDCVGLPDVVAGRGGTRGRVGAEENLKRSKVGTVS